MSFSIPKYREVLVESCEFFKSTFINPSLRVTPSDYVNNFRLKKDKCKLPSGEQNN